MRLSSGCLCVMCAQVGDSVAPGDIFCEVETDKATIGWDSQEDGFLAQVSADGAVGSSWRNVHGQVATILSIYGLLPYPC